MVTPPQENDDAAEREVMRLLDDALSPGLTLLRHLGAGGMGAVYLARDPALKRLVAVKVMRGDRGADPEARARFQREAEAVAAISHPNVVAIYSVGELANGLPYFVMQYVDGPSMAERLLQEGPLDLESAKTIIGQVAAGLAAAHGKGITHRDIKTANILWDDAAGRALVSDFGIAAIAVTTADAETAPMTEAGMIVGTPRYMSPEQLLAEPVTTKTDIYSLGLLGYELLTGEMPYRISSLQEIIAAHLRDVPRPLSDLRPDAGPELEGLLASCLAKDPESRPSAEEVEKRLGHGASALLEWPPPGLEDLHGRAAAPAARLFLATLAMAAPLAIVASVSSDSSLALGWPEFAVIPALQIMGLMAAARSIGELWPLLRGARRAAGAGYDWAVIAEAAADASRDTGSIITGEREYAILPVAVRDWLRQVRVRRMMLQLWSSGWVLGAYVLGLPLAVALGTPRLFALWLVSMPSAVIVALVGMRRKEHQLLGPIRKRLRHHRQDTGRLTLFAHAWSDSFARLPSAQLIRGWSRPGVLRRALGAMAAVGVGIVATAMVLSMTAIALVGEYARGARYPDFSSAINRVAEVEPLRTWRPPTDPSITPRAAGEALVTFVGSQPPPFGAPSVARKRSPRSRPPFRGDVSGVEAVRAAVGGLTVEQREYLRKMAAADGHAEYGVLARAGTVDWLDAALRHPLPEQMRANDIGFPKLSGILDAARENIARAALAADAKQFPEAERLLRENVGVGFLLIDEPTVFENLTGQGIVADARDGLIALFEGTGRLDDARRLRIPGRGPMTQNGILLFDSPISLSPAAREEYLDSAIASSRVPRGVRFALTTNFAALQPCTDIRQVLFGPDARYYARLESARKTLVRAPGEEFRLRLFARLTEDPVDLEHSAISSPARTTLRIVTAVVDGATGSRRMTACSSMLMMR